MAFGTVVLILAAVAGWVYIFVPPREGLWVRSWTVAAVLLTVALAALVAAGELTRAVGNVDGEAIVAGLAVGVGWVIATQIGHAVLCRILPSFIDQVRSLYSIAASDRRRDVLVALVSMAVAEEVVFRLVLQREMGLAFGVVAYAGVQIVERNWALVVAGAACGLVWGSLYAWQGNLAAPLIAHLVWTPTLMFVWPLRGCAGSPVPEAAMVAVTDT